ncbi:MAG: AraC family transcriptional regulator [Victivallaceae bacterium]|jgi:AraC-like DNA-binding protein
MPESKIILPDEHFIRHFHYGNAGINLNSRISMTGFELARRGDYCWDGLKRGNAGFILWQYTVSGAGALKFEDKAFALHPGQAMLVKIPHDHCYQVDEQAKEWEFIFIIMRGSECLRICEEIIERRGPVANFYSSGKVLEAAEKIILHGSEKDSCEMSALAYSFAMCLGTEILINSNRTTTPEPLKSAKRYALKNFGNNINVSDLAQAAGMSYSHFVREFTLNFGVSPGAYILQLQLEKAVNLLQNSTLSVKEIAIECGFASSSYFCRAFLKASGISPGKYRQDHQ